MTLANILIGAGFLQSHPKDGSCKCVEEHVPDWKLGERGGKCFWRCKKCRKTISVLDQDQDIFSCKVSLRFSRSIMALLFQSYLS